MNLKPYPEYKDSGIPWLGQVPKDWEIKRLGSTYFERKQKVSDKDYPPLSVTKNGIMPQLSNAAKSNDGDNRKKVIEGDFVINSRSDRKGSSGLSNLTGSVSLINTVLIPKGIDSKFTHKLLKSHPFKEEFYRVGRGIVADLWSTKYSEMSTIMISLPSLTEQAKIARFLDWKTVEITKFIKAKKRIIELLKEQKKVIIDDAVTGKIDVTTGKPYLKYKDSGVEWLKHVPEVWEVKRLGSFFVERREKVNDRDFQPLSVSKSGVTLQLADAVKTDDGDNRKKVVKGDFAINSRSDRKGSSGLSNLTGSVSLINTVIKPTNIQGEYADKLFKSNSFVEEFYRNGRGIVADLWTTRYSEMRTIMILKPTDTEQYNISYYLDKKNNYFENTISRIEKEISLMVEYRDRLIADVVTGKIDVRDIVVPEVEIIEDINLDDDEIIDEESAETENNED